MEILIKRSNSDSKLPAYNREAGSGIDLFVGEEITIEPNERAMVSTGVSLALPVGYIGTILNQANSIVKSNFRLTSMVIDSGYRDEIVLEVFNLDTEPKTFAIGEKIAEMSVQQIERSRLIEVEDLDGTN